VTANLDNIDRVPAPRPDLLERRYMCTGTPVVITGLYDRAPVRRLADVGVAKALLGHLSLPIRANPLARFIEGRDAPIERIVRLGAFHDQLATGRRRDVCVEHDTPASLLGYAPPPPYVSLGDPADSWTTYLFMAGPGSTIHLHYDVDQRHFLVYQVFGRKRFVIIDPARSGELAPGAVPDAPYLSGLPIEDWPRARLGSFLRSVDAWDCVLQPGETLLVPAGAWHYVEYLDVSLSMTFRLPRNPYVRFLADRLPPTAETLALAARYRDVATVGPAEVEALREIDAAACRAYPSVRAQDGALEAVGARLCRDLRLPIAAQRLDGPGSSKGGPVSASSDPNASR
jgi:Cupin-like domain